MLETGVHDQAQGFTSAYFAHPEEIMPCMTAAGFTTLAQDANIMDKSGQILSTRPLARAYGFTDIDGTALPLDKGL